jgi:formylglycine-generating enzyme required for sulfatase activity
MTDPTRRCEIHLGDLALALASGARGQVLSWKDWSGFDRSPAAERLLRNLLRWRDGGNIEPEADTEAGASGRSEADSAEVAAMLAEIEDPATEPPRRLEIGDELDRLGDPRHGVGLDENGLPDNDWVEISAGPFICQKGETRELPTFWIGRYPVTNRQFQAFVDGGGYDRGGRLLTQARRLVGLSGRDTDWWQDLKQPKPEKSRWPQANRPRTNVDWYEAVAFTRWLTAQLGLPEGTIRLPTEYEWEKAARGEKGLIFPWGNEYRSGFANINEKKREDGPWGLKQTTAVGIYPQSRSPYGVEDLAGNVSEWCLEEYNKPDDERIDTSDYSRGLCGGSWVDGSVDARAARARQSGDPDLRVVFLIFGCCPWSPFLSAEFPCSLDEAKRQLA